MKSNKMMIWNSSQIPAKTLANWPYPDMAEFGMTKQMPSRKIHRANLSGQNPAAMHICYNREW